MVFVSSTPVNTRLSNEREHSGLKVGCSNRGSRAVSFKSTRMLAAEGANDFLETICRNSEITKRVRATIAIFE